MGKVSAFLYLTCRLACNLIFLTFFACCFWFLLLLIAFALFGLDNLCILHFLPLIIVLKQIFNFFNLPTNIFILYLLFLLHKTFTIFYQKGACVNLFLILINDTPLRFFVISLCLLLLITFFSIFLAILFP